MSRLLVTGANGFLGSWLTRALVEQGHEVSALVRKSSDLSELEGVNCRYVYGDIGDLSSLETPFKSMDSIFHLAGLIAYRTSERSNMEMVNIQGTANVLTACEKSHVKRLVHLSSVVAIGAGFSKYEVLNENSQYNIKHLNLGYFETKRAAEDLVKKACQENRIDAVILNPSTIYGAGDAKKNSRKMQIKVAQGKLPFYTSGGVNVVAVEDVVDGIIKAWHKGRLGERYILSSENLLIKDMFKIIAEEAGVKPPSILLPNWFVHSLGYLGDFVGQYNIKFPFSKENAWTSTLYHWFDSSKAQRELGFRPRPAREPLAKSVQWMKERALIK